MLLPTQQAREHLQQQALYIPVEIEFKRTINLRKYQSKVSAQAQNQYLSNKSD